MSTDHAIEAKRHLVKMLQELIDVSTRGALCYWCDKLVIMDDPASHIDGCMYTEIKALIDMIDRSEHEDYNISTV